MVTDPVCGTEVTAGASSPSWSLRGISYHFCSNQCLERFQATPALYTGARRRNEMPPMLKQRRLRLATAQGTLLGQADQLLRTVKGVSSVAIAKDNLTVAYDLRIVMLAQIEKVLQENGIPLRRGWHGWRRALWRFTEANESENAALAGTGACCSRPPARLR